MRLQPSHGRHPVRLPGQLIKALSLFASLIFAGPATADAAEFPQMRVETVSGITLDLPADFAGPSIILMVYDQNQQPQVDSWMTFLRNTAAANPVTRYYVIPVLPAGLSVVRGMVEGVIRSTAADPLLLDHTIILFCDVEALQLALGVRGTSALHVLVLGNRGQVVATASGVYSATNARIVSDGLAAAAPAAGDIGEPIDSQQTIQSAEYLR